MLTGGRRKLTLSRKMRREKLLELLADDPFLNDRQLAELLSASVATIRLDRMALNIPELRERTKNMAAMVHPKLKAIRSAEVIGEITEIELGSFGVSILAVTKDMVFERTHILRGHILFAQANSLAIAVINSDFALTASCHIRFYQPVKLGDRVIARATISSAVANRYVVNVVSRVKDSVVFRGDITVVDMTEREEILK